jgi:alpha-N-acetylglucosamine transferase
MLTIKKGYHLIFFTIGIVLGFAISSLFTITVQTQKQKIIQPKPERPQALSQEEKILKESVMKSVIDSGNKQSMPKKRAYVTYVASRDLNFNATSIPFDGYFESATLLVHTLVSYKDADVVVVVTPGTGNYRRRVFKHLGAIIKEIDPVPLSPKYEGSDKHDFYRDCFGKIALWNLTEYDSIFYIDADIWIRQDIRDVWKMPKIEEYDFASVLDIYLQGGNFNSGVFITRPSISRFETMKNYLFKYTKDWKGDHVDQNFLNWYWGRSFYVLPDEYNFIMPNWRKAEGIFYNLYKRRT